MWDTQFAPMHALNFGVGSERVENVLWRVINGEMDQMNPKAVVVFVGTNNHGNTAEQIAEGIEAIVDAIRERQSESYIIVLTLLPRGEKPNYIRDRNERVNSILSKILPPKRKTQLVNIDPGFVQPDGTISHHDMWDYLHLTKSGYSKAFEPVYDILQQLLGEVEGINEKSGDEDMDKARNLVNELIGEQTLGHHHSPEQDHFVQIKRRDLLAEQVSVVVETLNVTRNPLELELILNKVLSYLPVESLLNVRMVNQTWNSFAVDWIRKKHLNGQSLLSCRFPRLFCAAFEKCDLLPFSQLILPRQNLEEVLPFFLQHGSSVEGIYLTDAFLNREGRKSLGTIFKCVPNLKRLVLSGINSKGYAPGIPFYESEQTIQLTQVQYFLISADAKRVRLHKEFLDQIFALVPNVKKVYLDLNLDPNQDYQLFAEAMKKLSLTTLSTVPYQDSRVPLWTFIAGSQKLKELHYVKLESRSSHDLELVVVQEELLRSQSESLEVLSLWNEATPNNSNERATLLFPVMNKLKTLHLTISYTNNDGILVPLMVPIQPNQVPCLISLLLYGPREILALLSPSPFTSVTEITLFIEDSNCEILPEIRSRFPNLKKVSNLCTILEEEDMAMIVSSLRDIEELEITVLSRNPKHEEPDGDFSAFIAGISMDQKLILWEVAELVGVLTVLSWIDNIPPSLHDLKRLKNLKIVFGYKEKKSKMTFNIDIFGVYLGFLRLSPQLKLTLDGDFWISNGMASKMTDHFNNIIFLPNKK